MVAIRQQNLGLLDEMLLEVWDFTTYSHCAKSGFSAYVGIGAGDYGFDFWEEISRHFDGGNVSEGYQGETDNVLVRVIQVTSYISFGKRIVQ
jgi:hypothetical protein